MGATTLAFLRIFFLLIVGLFTLNSIQLIRYWHDKPLPVEVTIVAFVTNSIFSGGIVIKLLYDVLPCCHRQPEWRSV